MNTARNPYAPPQAEVADVAAARPSSQAVPELWNPGAAASWSLLLTPVFGAILHMKNWQALGEPERAASARAWAWGCFFFVLASVILSALMPESGAIDAVVRAAGLGILVGWYVSSGKRQMSYVKARYGKAYPRRGWTRPLLLALAAMAGFFVAAVVVGVIIGIAQGGL